MTDQPKDFLRSTFSATGCQEIYPHILLKKNAQGEVILYQPDNNSTQLEVRIDEETVWLTQAQMVELFSSTKQNISLHINNIYKDGELGPDSTVKEYLTVQNEGTRKVQRY